MLEKLKKLKVNIGWKSIVLIAVGVVLVLVDLLTKIFEERDGWNFKVIPNFIEVESGSRNPGCAFSFLSEAAWGQTFLIVMTFILLIVLIALFIFLPERFTFMKVAICLITAGAVGNLIDRIAYREVRDFVEINMFGSMVSCNFADFWIVIGTILAIVDIMFLNEWALIPLTKRAKAAQAEQAEEQKAEEANTQEQIKTDEETETSADGTAEPQDGKKNE